MKTIRVTDNLVMLDRLHFVNAYLVRESDGFTLVDTTLGGAADDLIAAASAEGGEIVRIALTHGHSDHAGSLDALKAKLGSRVEVLLGDLDARIHAGERVVEGKLRGSWPSKVQTRPDTRLFGGERVGSLEVIASPGHTPGHVAFLDVRDQTLIAGVPNRLLQPFPLAAMGTQDREQVVDSAQAALTLEPAVLVTGHGPPVRGPGSAMASAIARAARH
jgi:glyoxylase-like metal-dependent hydrolase (beta-lactamase superfamily II)